jgi:hypothetical protein
MTTDLSYVVKQPPAAPKLPILPVPLEPNIIDASVSAEVWHECPFQLGRLEKGHSGSHPMLPSTVAWLDLLQ